MTHLKFGKTLTLATAVAVGLWGSASFAEMSQFQQLEQQVINNLATIGVSSAKVGMLTMAEVAQLSSILGGSEKDVDKADAAKKLIETATTEPTRMKANEGTAQLEQQAMVNLSSLGLSIPDGAMLSPSQLSRLNAIFASMDSDADKKASAERVLADSMAKVDPVGQSGSDQLEQQLMGKLSAIGITEAQYGNLTMTQVAVLNSIFDSMDSDADKKQAAMKVLNIS